jgi:hypothetical protein
VDVNRIATNVVNLIGTFENLQCKQTNEVGVWDLSLPSFRGRNDAEHERQSLIWSLFSECHSATLWMPCDDMEFRTLSDCPRLDSDEHKFFRGDWILFFPRLDHLEMEYLRGTKIHDRKSVTDFNGITEKIVLYSFPDDCEWELRLA